MIVTDVWFVGERGRVDGKQQHVVTTRHQLGGHRVVAQATAAIHPARPACEIKNSQFQSSDGDCVLECAARVKMFEEIPLVWLIPANLIGRQRADVETVDARRRHERLDKFWIFGDGCYDECWTKMRRDLILIDLDHTGEG